MKKYYVSFVGINKDDEYLYGYIIISLQYKIDYKNIDKSLEIIEEQIKKEKTETKKIIPLNWILL